MSKWEEKNAYFLKIDLQESVFTCRQGGGARPAQDTEIAAKSL
jgi:hypothetical protein